VIDNLCSFAQSTLAIVGNTPRMAEPPRLPTMLEGDIVVTRVARHYSIGRVNVDGRTQTPIEVQADRNEAVRRACLLAAPDHRVFIVDVAARPSTASQIDCTDMPEPP
jgi:hypothetical protein